MPGKNYFKNTVRFSNNLEISINLISRNTRKGLTSAEKHGYGDTHSIIYTESPHNVKLFVGFIESPNN